MAFVTRYFDVAPGAQSIAYGLTGFSRGRLDKIAEDKAKELRKRKKRQKNTAIIGTAAATALTAGLAAPALGLAGAPATAGAFTTGTGSILPAAATTGILGSGGVTSLGGLITAGALGAQAGGMFADEDFAGGISSLASPFVAQAARDLRLSDRGVSRAENLSDAMTLDRSRTDQNIREFQERQSIAEYGMPRAEATQAAIGDYEAAVGAAPGAGSDLGDISTPQLGAGENISAMGPLGGSEPNVPGPSRIPGMKRDWGPAQYRQLARLEQQRADTVDNPEWIAAHSPEERAMNFEALVRARQNIRVTTMPDQPKPMTMGPNGEPVPMQLGWNRAPDGGWSYLDNQGDQQHVAPTKQSEVSAPWNDPNFAKLSPEQKRAANIAFGKTRIIPGSELGPGYDQDSDYAFDDKGTPYQFKHQKGDDYDVSDYLKEAKALEKPDPTGPLTKPPVRGTPEEVLAARETAEVAVETFNARKKVAAAVEALDPATIRSLPELRALSKRVAEVYGTEKWPPEIVKKLEAIEAGLTQGLGEVIQYDPRDPTRRMTAEEIRQRWGG